MKPQIVGVEDRLDSLRHFDINSGVVNKDARIDKICLSLSLAAAQTRQETIRLDQTHTRLRQTNAVAVPERKLPADEIWIVEDRIKAGRLIVSGIRVTLRPEKRSFESQVVVVDRRLDRGHVRFHPHVYVRR